MALSSGHLELSARLGSRHRRRCSPVPRRARRTRWGARQRGSRLGRGRAFLGGLDGNWRRSMVKASYSRNGRSASWGAHGTYLAREGAQREGGKGRGFSAEQEGIDLPATLRGWQRAGDERLWKFIVSPEHSERLDLKAPPTYRSASRSASGSQAPHSRCPPPHDHTRYGPGRRHQGQRRVVSWVGVIARDGALACGRLRIGSWRRTMFPL
jgi:hypothetical protein